MSSELFTQLQRLSSLQALMTLLEQEQGPPPNENDEDNNNSDQILDIDEEQKSQGYLPVAKVLLDSYEKADSLFEKIRKDYQQQDENNNNNNDSASSLSSSLLSTQHHVALFSSIFNIDDHPQIAEFLEKHQQHEEESSSSSDLATTIADPPPLPSLSQLESLKQERDLKRQQLEKDDDDIAIEQEPLLPYSTEDKIFALLQSKLSNLNLKKAIGRGILAMVNKQAEEEAKQQLEHHQKQAEIERQKMEAFNRNLLLKNVVSSSDSSTLRRGGNNDGNDGNEEYNMMNSVLGVGINLDDSAGEGGGGNGDDDEDSVRNQIEIERLDLEPQFLKSMGVSFRRKIEEANRQRKSKEIETAIMRKRAKDSGRSLRDLKLEAEREKIEKQKRMLDKHEREGGAADNKNNNNNNNTTANTDTLLRHVPQQQNIGARHQNSMELALKRRVQSLKEQRSHEAMYLANGDQNINNRGGNGNNNNNNSGTGNHHQTFTDESANEGGGGSSLHLTLERYRNKNSHNKQQLDVMNNNNNQNGNNNQFQPPPGWNNNTKSEAERKREQIQQQRSNLPIAKHKQLIINTIKSQRVTVLVGETGSGKTTQLSQYLYDGGFCNPLISTNNNEDDSAQPTNNNNNKNKNKKRIIACTQPRLIAAKTVAARVADEFGCKCGEEVGYTVRFDDCTSPLTLIKYMTDGVLLREALMDDTFSKYSVIILDEAHERNLNTDILFALCKKAISKNPNLTIVATSATLDAEKFCKWWGCEQMLKIEGRTYPVDRVWLKQPCDDYFEEALNTVMRIHIEEKPGDILVFFTGKEEIETGKKRLERYMESEELRGKVPPLIITRLYAGLPDEDKAKALEDAPPLSRKVVLSTNIAETSVTIDGLYYVIDCGYHKQNIYNPKTGVDTLAVVPIARSQAKQRAGRAGRTGPGRCYFLYTEEQFLNDMPEAIIPEIQRTNLANVVLTLKAIGFHNILSLDFMDPPPVDALVNALEHLYFLSALDNDGALTSLGSRMSQLPVSPNESRALLTALEFGCLDPVLTIVAMLGESHIFSRPKEKQEEADRARLSFAAAEGDHITLLRVWEACQEQLFSVSWMKSNFLNPNAISRCRELRNQLMGLLKRNLIQDRDVQDKISKQEQDRVEMLKQQKEQNKNNSNQNNNNNKYSSSSSSSTFNTKYDLTLVRKALIAGYFYHAARRNPNQPNEYISLTDQRTMHMPISCVLFGSTPKFIIYHELVETTKEYMRECLSVDPMWLLEMAPNFFKSPGAGKKTDAQKRKKIDPLLRAWESHGGSKNTWRISKLRVPKKT